MNDLRRPVVGVGAVVFRGDEVLVVRRGKTPFEGHWSIPGGRLEYGEAIEDALAREVREETGAAIDIIAFLGVFEALPEAANAPHTIIVDYVAEWRAGAIVAGDDAAAAEFVPIDEAQRRLSWDKTRLALRRAIEIRKSARPSP